jgi:hypothetical protein
MTRKEADQVIDRLQSNWPKEQMPAATRATYLLAIADLDYGLANAATLQAIATRTWFPKPAELRQIAAELVQSADGKPSAEDAWDEFYAAARKYGFYQVPPWSHPAVEAVAKTIGYREYCLSEEADVTIWRAQFLKAYAAHSERATRQMQMLPQVRQLVESLRMDRPRQAAALTEGEK